MEEKIRLLIVQQLERIANHLFINARYVEDNTLFAGKPGIALFNFHYARAFNDASQLFLANQLLEDTIQNMGPNTETGYGKGLCGIGSLISYLVENDFIDIDEDDFFPELDKELQSIILNPEICRHKKSGELVGYSAYLQTRSHLDEAAEMQYALAGYMDQIVANAYTDICKSGPGNILSGIDKVTIYGEVLFNPATFYYYKTLYPYERLRKQEILLEQQNSLLIMFSDEEAATKKIKQFPVFLLHMLYMEATICPAASLISPIREILDSIFDTGIIRNMRKQGIWMDSLLNIILITRNLYHSTHDSYFAGRMEQAIKILLQDKKELVAGISLQSRKPLDFCFAQGLAGTGLILLSCLTEVNIPWVKLMVRPTMEKVLNFEHIK